MQVDVIYNLGCVYIYMYIYIYIYIYTVNMLKTYICQSDEPYCITVLENTLCCAVLSNSDVCDSLLPQEL